MVKFLAVPSRQPEKEKKSGLEHAQLEHALDELTDLIIAVASDEKRLSAVAAELARRDLKDLCLPIPDTFDPVIAETH